MHPTLPVEPQRLDGPAPLQGLHLDRWQESKAVKKQILVKYMVLSSLLIIIDRKTQHTLFGHNMK